MATALSIDLRTRVIAAVDGGMSRRRAAAPYRRYGLPRGGHRRGPGKDVEQPK